MAPRSRRWKYGTLYSRDTSTPMDEIEPTSIKWKKRQKFWSSTKQNKTKLTNINLKIGDDTITPSTSVRNLGSWLDDSMTMREQIKRTTKASYCHLRNLNHIRRNLDEATCAKVINATITSRQDYHNGLLSGAHNNVIRPQETSRNYKTMQQESWPRLQEETTSHQYWKSYTGCQSSTDFKVLRCILKLPADTHIEDMLVSLRWMSAKQTISKIFKPLIILNPNWKPTFLEIFTIINSFLCFFNF